MSQLTGSKLTAKRIAVIIGAIIIPLMYSYFYLGAFWDPYDHLQDVPVAVVNADEGTYIDGKERTVGDEIRNKLTEDGTLKFVFTDEEKAVKGTKGDKYYAMIKIPENFSEQVASIQTDDKQTPTLEYMVNDKRNYLASQILSTAVGKIEKTLAYNFDGEIVAGLAGRLSAVPDQLGTLADGMDEMYNGALKLEDGAGQLSSGTIELDNGIARVHGGTVTLANGANKLSSGANSLYSGIKKVNSGAKSLDDGASQLKTGIKSADNGAGKLANGAKSVSDGASSLSDGASSVDSGAKSLSDGASNLESGLGQLQSGMNSLSEKLPELTQGIEKLDEGMNGDAGLVNGLKQYTAGVSNVKDGISQVKNGAAALESGVSATKEGIVSAAGSNLGLTDQQKAGLEQIVNQAFQGTSDKPGLEPGISSLKSGVESVSDGLDKLTSQNDTLNGGAAQVGAGIKSLNDSVPQLTEGVNSLSSGIDSAKSGSSALSKGASQLSDGTSSLASGADTLKSGTSSLSSGADSLSAGTSKLVKGASSLSDGTGTLYKGTQQLQSGSKTLADGTGSLDSGAKTLSSGTARLASGSNKLATGAGALADGTTTLADGIKTGENQVSAKVAEAKEQVSVLDGMGEQAAEPVKVDEKNYEYVPNYGTAFAPYFMSLSLWVGGLMIFFGIYFDMDRRFKYLGRDSKNVVLRSFVFLLLGLAQALLLALVATVALGLKVHNMTAFVCACVFVSIVFMSIIQFCIVHLGDIGKFLSLLLLILQLTSCGGTFPMETVPRFFQVLYPYMPMTYSVGLFKETISGGVGVSMKKNIIVLFIILVIMMVATILMSLLKLGGRKVRERLQESAA